MHELVDADQKLNKWDPFFIIMFLKWVIRYSSQKKADEIQRLKSLKCTYFFINWENPIDKDFRFDIYIPAQK